VIALHIIFNSDDAGAAGMAHRYLSFALLGVRGVLVRMPLHVRGKFRESLVLQNREVADIVANKLRVFGHRFEIVELTFPGITIEKPVIIIGAPRSGTSLLFETLAVCPELWALAGESHAAFEAPGAIPGERGNRLGAADADPDTREKTRVAFLAAVRDRNRRLYSMLTGTERPDIVRLLEKTPRNSLRIPFLKSLFPDCKFVFIYRQPHTNLASLLDRWYAPGPPTYTIDGFDWKFLMVPGWRGLMSRPVPEIAAVQWAVANTFIVNDLAKLPREDWCSVRYEELVANPVAEITRICRFTSVDMDGRVMDRSMKPLPLSRSTLTPPDPDKWRRHEEVLKAILPSIEDAAAAVEAFLKL
jgi:Sulfotransferase family